MKKTYLLLLVLFAFGIANAQNFQTLPYAESFENGMGGWTACDGDGDGYNWRTVDFSSVPPIFAALGYFAHDGNAVLYSESALDTVPLHPSNWVVSPIFEIPASTSDTISFSWWVKGFASGKPDRYQVRIASVSTIYDTTVDTSRFYNVLYDETVNFTNYQQRSVSLADYEGQLIRLAFHHYASYGSSLQIDMVTLGNDSLPLVAVNGPMSLDRSDTATYYAQLRNGSTDGLTFTWISDSADYIENAYGDSTRMMWTHGGVFRLGVAASNAYGSDTAWMTVAVSNCDIIDTFPFTENFTPSSLTLSCWKMYDGDHSGEAWTYHDGWVESNSITFFGLVNMADNWLISPPLALGDTYNQLLWQVRPKNNDYPAEHYTVYVSLGEDPFDTSLYVPLFSETLTADSNWQLRFLSLGDYVGDTVRIAFRHHLTDDQDALQLTGFTIEPASAPIIQLHAPAQAIVGDSVHFRLDTFSVSPIQDITWRVHTDTLGSYSTVSSFAPLTFVWSNSTAEGDYWVFVDATNNEGTSTDSALVHLHVCEVVNTLPYLHTFGQGDEDCWRISEGWTVDDSILVDTVPTAAAVSFSHDQFGHNLHANNRIASPYIHIPDSSYELRYMVTEAFCYYAEYAIDLYNVIIRHNGITDTIVRGAVGTNDLQRHRVYLGAYAGEDIQVEFLHYDSPMGNALQLAEVQIVAVGAPEIAISAPERGRVGEPVFLSASVVSSETLNYLWTLPSATPSTDTTLNVTARWDSAGTYTIILQVTSPLYGTYYDTAQITIIECSSIDTLPYVEHFDIDMACWESYDLDGDGYAWEMAVGSSPASRMFAAALTYGSTGNSLISWSTHPASDLFTFTLSGNGIPLHADDLLLSPAITLPDSGEWQFQFHAASAVTRFPTGFSSYAEGLDSLEVLITTVDPEGELNLNDFTVLQSMQPTDSTHFTDYTISLSDYLGQTFRLAVRHRSTAKVGLILDEFSINLPAPTLYTVTIGSDNSAMGTATGGGTVADGASITITATSNPGYHFLRWNDGNTDSVRTVTITSDTTFVAYFEANAVGIGDNCCESAVRIFATDGCIIVEENVENLPIRIMDITGRTLLTERATRLRHPMSHAGIYFVKVGHYPARKVVVIL